jgi:hypothetical protein
MIWKRELIWDESKKNIIGSNPNAFNLGNVENDAKLKDDWWSLVNDEEEVLGYGWIKYENAMMMHQKALKLRLRAKAIDEYTENDV